MKHRKLVNFNITVILWAVALSMPAQEYSGNSEYSKSSEETTLTLVEYNCENFFDCRHDSLKNDYEWTPSGARKWDERRYWNKQRNIARALLACGETDEGWEMPDLIALCEVENDSVLRDLTRRSLLRRASYEYVMTDSPDQRGIDVALLYSPFSFRLLDYHSLHVDTLPGMRSTRDVLYVSGLVGQGDTLHIFVVHAPSKVGGDRRTRAYRRRVAERIITTSDSIRAVSGNARIVVMGDFNEGCDGDGVTSLTDNGFTNVSGNAKGSNGAKGSYYYDGKWEMIDHVLLSDNMRESVIGCHISDKVFMLDTETTYGRVSPRRNYKGYHYQNGFSDHLPLVVKLRL